MEHTPYLEVEPGSERGFAAVFAVLFAAMGSYFLIAASGVAAFWGGAAALALALLLALIGWLRPISLRPLNHAWFSFGIWLGKWLSPLILGMVFFAVLTPLALLSRLFGSDPLRLRASHKQRHSHWIDRPKNG